MAHAFSSRLSRLIGSRLTGLARDDRVVPTLARDDRVVPTLAREDREKICSLLLTDFDSANTQFLISTPPMIAMPVMTRILWPSPSIVRVLSP